MIYCPKCGTANRDGSRFCNECGAPLPHTGVRCPECNETNPTGNVFCDYCGARLVAPSAEIREKADQEKKPEETGQAPIKGLSLPTIPLDEEAEEDLPASSEGGDWLSQLRATMADEEADAQPAQDFGAGTEEEIPDWLKEVTESEEEAAPEPPPSAAEFPAQEEPLPPETPEWLAESEPEPPAAPPNEDVPSREEEPPADVEVPDWLADLDVESPFEPASDEEPPSTHDVPLSEAEPPDWLADLDIETPMGPPTQEAATIDEPQPGESEPPDWMAEPVEEPSPPPAMEPEQPTEEPRQPAEEPELPDWLAELGAQASGTPSEEEAPPSQEPAAAEPPDWLAESIQESTAPPEAEPEPPAAEAPPVKADMPDWLADLGAQASSAEAEEAGPSLEETTPADTEVPDWLAEVEEEAPSTEEAPAPAADVPDWLAELDEEAPAAPPSEGVSPFEEASLAEAEVPDWLRELEEPTPAAGPGEPSVEETEIPDWLKEAAPSEGGLPARPPAPPAAADAAPGDLEPGEIPDWLMPLRPGAEGPGEAAQRITPAEAGLAPADIPDWLEAMRPRTEAAPQEERVEEEGLLEGLRGTLPPSPLVEATGKVEAAPTEATAAAVIARAELLQELLSRPAPLPQRQQKQKERAERRHSTGWAIQHAVVAILLLAAILAPQIAEWAGFELLSNEMLLATTGTSEQVVQVFETIETQTEPQTPVLVAFEYGAAEADEMDRVAGPLVQHLLAREARILFVSTNPQGPMLVERLGADLVAQNNVSQTAWDERVANLGYFPAQATGIQRALLDLRGGYWPGAGGAQFQDVSSAEDVALVLVLAGQPNKLQSWIEQTATLAQTPPLIAGVGARVEPLAQPYQQAAQQLQGVVAGLTDAAAYENQLQVDDGQATEVLQSLTLARLLISGLMLTGAVVFMIGGRRR